METQEDLNIGIGTKEVETLKPAAVKIETVRVDEVGDKKNKKVVCTSKHPDREDPIDISSIQYLKKKAVVTAGLWLNKDEDGLIRKGSTLAILMDFLKVKNIKELEEKEVGTVEDEKGYLCFKAY